MKSLYDKLGISEFASTAEIKAAFAKIAAVKHPNNTSNSDDLYDFSEAFKAHEILCDAKNRKQYDRLLRMGQNSKTKTYRWQLEQEEAIKTDYEDLDYKDFVKKRIYIHMFSKNPMEETATASGIAILAIVCSYIIYYIIDTAKYLSPRDDVLQHYAPIGIVGLMAFILWYLVIHFFIVQHTNRKIAKNSRK